MLMELKTFGKQISTFDCSVNQKLDMLRCNPTVLRLLEKKYDFSSSFKELTCVINILYSQEANRDCDESDINNVMAIIPGYYSCIKIDKDKFKALFLDPVSLILANLAFSQFEFKSHQFKFKISDLSITKKPVKVKKKLRKQSFLVNQENKPPANNNNKQKYKQNKGQSKFTCKYNILIENQKNFHIAKKIIGSKGCNMKNIISAALKDCEYTQDHKTNNLIKLRLRGKGSGFKEGPENKESNETLQLCISCKSFDLYKMTCKHVDSLFEKILKSYVNYMKNKKGVNYEEKPVFYNKQEFFYN